MEGIGNASKKVVGTIDLINWKWKKQNQWKLNRLDEGSGWEDMLLRI